MILRKLKELIKSEIELITLKEIKLLHKIKNKVRHPLLDPVMGTLTMVGSAGAIWAIPAVKMLGKKETRLDGFLTLFGIGLNVISNNLITKFFFHRKRPCTRYPEEYILNSLPLGYSFPSGHALTSFTAATILTLSNWRNIFWALPLASSIAFSRAYLFVHYPTDIIFGIINGIVDGVIIYKLGHRYYAERRFPILNYILDQDRLFTIHIF